MKLNLLRMVLVLIAIGRFGAATSQTMEEKTINVRENTVVSYTDQGSGEITLLFIPGWCIDKSYWVNQLDHFENNYRVLAIDLPGFGNSTAERESWTIEEYSEDILAFMNALDLKKTVIIGHSMAGEIMLEAALRDSSRICGLVGVDNFKYVNMTFTEEEMAPVTEFMAALRSDFKKANAVYSDYNLFLPDTEPELRNRVKADIDATDPKIGYDSFSHLMQYAATESDKLEDLHLKLNLINSTVPPTNETGLNIRCRSYAVKYVGAVSHYPMVEVPDLFNKRLENILDQMK